MQRGQGQLSDLGNGPELLSHGRLSLPTVLQLGADQPAEPGDEEEERHSEQPRLEARQAFANAGSVQGAVDPQRSKRTASRAKASRCGVRTSSLP